MTSVQSVTTIVRKALSLPTRPAFFIDAVISFFYGIKWSSILPKLTKIPSKCPCSPTPCLSDIYIHPLSSPISPASSHPLNYPPPGSPRHSPPPPTSSPFSPTSSVSTSPAHYGCPPAQTESYASILPWARSRGRRSDFRGSYRSSTSMRWGT